MQKDKRATASETGYDQADDHGKDPTSANADKPDAIASFVNRLPKKPRRPQRIIKRDHR